MKAERKAQIRAMLAVATQGPWRWFGNTKTYDVYLATVNRGRVFVMDFVRWGMSGAQPRFQVRINDAPDKPSGIMRSVGDLGSKESPLGPRFEASHRRQFTGIGHPDAVLIEQAPTIISELLARVDQLEIGVRCAATALRMYNTESITAYELDDLALGLPSAYAPITEVEVEVIAGDEPEQGIELEIELAHKANFLCPVFGCVKDGRAYDSSE